MNGHPSEDRISKIVSNLPQRVSDVAEQWAKSSPEHIALVEASGTWSYGKLARVVLSTEKWLQHLAVRPGDRVMVVCENCRSLVAILFATAAIDAWPVLVSARLSSREIDEIREHSGARLVIYTTEISVHAAQHAERHSAIIQEVAELGSLGVGGFNGNAIPEPLDHEVTDRVAALIYTSGTTGMPKGVMLTHKNLLYVGAVSADIRKLSPEDRLYGVLPISHAVGLSVVLLGSLLSGATLYLAPRFDPVAALATIEQKKLTVVLGAPSMFSLLLEYAKLKGAESFNFPSLRIISSSSAPLQPDLKSDVEEAFGLTLHNGYGITECSPNIAQTRTENPRTDVSVGPIFPGVEVKLTGVNGRQVGEGEVGELSVRGPNVMKGYYRNPEETAAAMDAEGWFNTRDLARLENGSLFIVGRTKELIVRFGFNVYPAEVEAVLNRHPEIVQSAVIGQQVSGEDGGEEIVAFVQTLSGSDLTADQLAEYASQRLIPYKRPSKIQFVSAMPVTPTGKVIKSDLIKMLNTAPIDSTAHIG
jgi:acyl-CoA synthetase (AMP-forming)/AMP-acid ligase II